MNDYRMTAAPIIQEFLTYHEVIRNHSASTVDAYYRDLRFFIYWLRKSRHLPEDSEMVDLDLLGSVKKTDIYGYITWLSRDRKLSESTRARRLAAVRSLYEYLTVKTEKLTYNPTLGIENPRKGKRVPVYLNETQAEQLLDAPSGAYELRDRTIIALFLVCGLRISELVGMNINDVSIQDKTVRVLGKGNKERVVYLSNYSQSALKDYLAYRNTLRTKPSHEKALFLSRLGKRISVRRVQEMVDEKLKAAGLDSETYSPHKLRHTAATLMLQNGVDIRVLQEILGHERLDTTQIYTHVENTDLRIAAEASPIGKKSKT